MVGFFCLICRMRTYPDIELHPLTIDVAESELMQMLMSAIAWRDEYITMFGKTMLQPRRVAWYGDAQASYTYSGIRHEPLPWIPVLDELRSVIEHHIGTKFNSVLCNLYRNGFDSMGYHSDDEPELGLQPIIASFSIGAERILHFRHRFDRSLPTIKVPLPSLSVLVMRGMTQQEWKHALPKTKRCDMPRVNLTFRAIRVG